MSGEEVRSTHDVFSCHMDGFGVAWSSGLRCWITEIQVEDDRIEAVVAIEAQLQ